MKSERDVQKHQLCQGSPANSVALNERTPAQSKGQLLLIARGDFGLLRIKSLTFEGCYLGQGLGIGRCIEEGPRQTGREEGSRRTNSSAEAVVGEGRGKMTSKQFRNGSIHCGLSIIRPPSGTSRVWETVACPWTDVDHHITLNTCSKAATC